MLGDLAGLHLSAAFQPLMDLSTARPVAAEALLRPVHHGLPVPPAELLALARAHGLVAELDLAAIRCAVQAPVGEARGTMFVNVEPATLVDRTQEVMDALDARRPGLDVVVEVTERSLAADPAGLLRAVDRLHAHGTPLALDDVGAEPQSLALLDLIRPAVVKLDMALLRGAGETTTLHIAGAVAGYAETTGARVVAEGIETPRDLQRAQVLGADLGQGWLWGRESREWPAPGQHPVVAARAVLPTQRAGASTPFTVVAGSRPVRTATKDLLVPLSLAVEAAAAAAPLPAVLLATFQHVRNVPTSTLTRYREFASTLPVVGMIGESLTDLRVPGAHVSDICADDPLATEWTVVALGAQSAVALVAREVPGQVVRDRDRLFDFATTRDRRLVVAAARTLLARLDRT
ncbi:MAG TPA: EAL domain-containing protein [Actinotalea sp.]|nr:EAL domain-containing protein [Actinotalea sp.]